MDVWFKEPAWVQRGRGQSALTPMVVGLTLILFFAAPVIGTSDLSAQEPAVAGGDGSHLWGTVVNRATREPIARALVFSNDNRFAAWTDDRGRFEFTFSAAKNETPADRDSLFVGFGRASTRPVNGFYRPQFLGARKPGFMATEEGQEQMPLGPTQQEITLYLVPEARVIGHVLVKGSDGSDRIRVSLYRLRVEGGRQHWGPVGELDTRVDGEFRFTDLPPGSYKLFTREFIDRDPLTFDPRGQIYGYPPVYYPAAGDFASGQVIQLTAGETVQATITPTRSEYYRVRMGLTNLEPGQFPEVHVSPQGHQGPGYELGYDVRGGAIRGLLPNGTYNVQVRTQGSSTMTGMANLTVAGGAADGPPIVLLPATSIAVNVREELQKEKPQMTTVTSSPNGESLTHNPLRPSYLNVELIPDEDVMTVNAPGRMRGPSGPEDTSLTLENVTPGIYRVRASTQIGYVAAISSGGTDLLRQLLVVGAGATPPAIEVTVRDDGAEVEGVVEDAGKELAANSAANSPSRTAGTVYFLPTESGARFLQAWVGTEGKFQLLQVPPGEYRVLAFDRPRPDLEVDGGQKNRHYDAKTQYITVTAGQKEHLRLQMIATEE